jgi:DNA-binding response OmpR family regulator
MPDKILIVEDEPALQETLAYNLARQGYLTETAGDGYTALEAARRFLPDLVLLDLMLPGLDGIEVCRILRQETSIPIIMLTARDDEIDRIIGLEIGADDYVTKPFSIRELLARIKAHLRRARLDQAAQQAPAAPAADILRFGNLSINLTRHEVLLDDQPLALRPKEYDLLLLLAQHQGQVLTRELIMQRVWGWEFSGGSRTVDVHVRWLREKIERDPTQPARIVTVRSTGYRFEG